jgi:cell division protein FtsI (penicillin-binding protein 3)
MRHAHHPPHLTLHQRSASRNADIGRARIVMMGAFFSLCFLSLCWRLIDISIGDRSFIALAQEAFSGVRDMKQSTLDGVDIVRGISPYSELWKPSVPEVVMPRQTIRDRNGVLLASSVATRSLYAKPAEIKNVDAVIATVSTIIPDVDARQLKRRLTSSAKFVWLKRHITPKEQEALLWQGIPGVYMHDDYQRVYPHGRLFSHVLGYSDVDGAGISGVEKHFDESLRRDDTLKPLQLSLDVRMQQALLDIVETYQMKHSAVSATGAIFHIPTSQARAMISLPDYNPNLPNNATKDAQFNRLSFGMYELGSIFKTFSIALAIEHGGVRLHDGFDASQPLKISGMTIRDFHGKNRWLNVPEIFAYSSNIGTVKMMRTAGAEKQRTLMTQLGMFERVPIELNERALPSTSEHWQALRSATISYGHGISVSPLHLIQGLIAMTNGGNVRGITLLNDTPKDATPVISKETSKHINRLLRSVVQHGTAGKADVTGYEVGGKTGTADKAVAGGYSKNKKISSMVAAFPMSNPEYLIFVMLDEPQGTTDTFNFATAGWVAAPAIADVTKAIAAIEGIPPVYFTPEDEVDMMITNAAAFAQHQRKQHYIRNASF